MIDLTDSKSDGTGILSKVQIRRDGSSDESLLFDIDIAFEIQSIDEAIKADKVIPGAKEMFNSSELGEERRITVRSTIPDSSLHLEVVSQDGESLIACPSEVRTVVFSSNASGSIITNRFRLFGVAIEDSIHLLNRLGKRITIVAEKPQQVLDFSKAGPTDNDQSEELAQIVTYDKENGPKFGMLVNDGDGPLVEVSNFSTLRSVPRDSILSTITVSGPTGTNLSRQLTKYHMESRQSDCSPDWKWLILSLGERYADNLVNTDSLVIDDMIIQDAITKASVAI